MKKKDMDFIIGLINDIKILIQFSFALAIVGATTWVFKKLEKVQLK